MAASQNELNTLRTHGPGFPLIFLLPHISTQSLLGEQGEQETIIASTARRRRPNRFRWSHVVTARVMAILSQLAIVLGLVLVGMRHFDNMKTGIAAATLYLLLPYTAMWTGSVTHALPGALLVWAIVMYRRPLLAGAMIGLAFGTIYYPVFLLPLWISFYWQRGLTRFLIGAAGDGRAAGAGAGVHVERHVRCSWPACSRCSACDCRSWTNRCRRVAILEARSIATRSWRLTSGLSLSMALWPAQKNLGTLISYSAAVMLGTQFWHAHSGGLALAWYLPLLLLTIFRPNLEDRVALAVVK